MYRCKGCGSNHEKYSRNCWNCGASGSIVPEAFYNREFAQKSSNTIRKLSDYATESLVRLPTIFPTLNRALGGGFAVPSVIQFGGEPGIGKSTLLLQLANGFADNVLYIGNEENGGPIHERAQRLKLSNIDRISLEVTDSATRAKELILASGAQVVIIDSLQGFEPDEEGVTITQNITGDIALDLCNFAVKKDGTEYEHRRGHPVCLILISHVNKATDLAGLKKIQHMVDVIAWFRGDPNYKKRVFKLNKNRKGPSTYAAVFTMEEDGLHESVVPENEHENEEKTVGHGEHNNWPPRKQ